MLFDTDVLIWVQRGSTRAADAIDRATERLISVVTYMELLQCPTSKQQIRATKDFVSEFGFQLIPLSANVGHRAAVYVEELSAATGIRVGDALVAATAVEGNFELLTSNRKHFGRINGLKLRVLKP